jgi:hypothetical protein
VAQPAVGVLERQLARRERADAAGDEDGPRRILVLIGDDDEGRGAVLPIGAQRGDLLSQMHRRLELERLIGHALHEIFGENLGKAGHVEDVLLRVQRRELAAELIEVVDEPAGRAAHPGVERAEQPRGTGTDDGDIFHVLHGGNGNETQREWGVGSGS